MSHVFLSYCRDNLDQAAELHALLTSAGLQVWWDQDDLPAGVNFKVAIPRAIKDAAQFVFCMSSRIVERVRNGTYEEIRQAIARIRELPPDNNFLVPVRFDDCELPAFEIDASTTLTDLNWIDLFGDNWREQNLPRLLKSLGVADTSPKPARPKPKLRKDHTRELREQAVKLRGQQRELAKSGQDTSDIQQQLQIVRTQIRDGPMLGAGEWLGGRYELIQPIGSGGFATVWKAWDEESHELVAVKVLHGQFAASQERLDRFRRGAKAMHKLTHPHIVRVLDPDGEDAGFHFFVMEYLSGGTFAEAVESDMLDQDRKLELLQQVGEALEFAHTQGAIHRDVTPENIILDDSHGTAKLTDFDLVRLQDSTGGTRTGSMGKFVYAAPESQESANTVDVRADVYSFAMTVTHALNGRKLPPMLVIRNTDGFINELVCEATVKRVLERGLAFEPDSRIGSIREFCSLLRDAVKPEATPAKPKSSKPKPKPKRKSAKKRSRKQSRPVELELVQIEGGEFLMGGTENEAANPSEMPQHRVVITQPFLLGKYAVTQAEYEAVMGKNPSQFTGNNRQPVENVSWLDAVEFCNRLSDQHGLANYYQRKGDDVTGEGGEGFRLPTEAEWEYACRAGTSTRYNLGDAESDLKRAGWYGANAGKTTHPVGEKEPNSWGLFDMHGNVYEWCWDWFANYEQSPTDDPRGPARASFRAYRGGSWSDSAQGCRSASRGRITPSNRYSDLGFRLAQGPVR
ncbi:MAG: SUMF1/EgtB/PvdO family nonheme iron enzyme [Planctomycetota bacterium]|nr:SUMF1/EgtB/PvdO family nonheme iron enzyme [Planctomycetota bacterium]